jgi:hypothetical protein
LIALELQDFSIRHTARISHHATSGSSARWEKLERSTFGDQVEVLLALKIIFSKISHEEFILVFGEWRSRLRE